MSNFSFSVSSTGICISESQTVAFAVGGFSVASRCCHARITKPWHVVDNTEPVTLFTLSVSM